MPVTKSPRWSDISFVSIPKSPHIFWKILPRVTSNKSRSHPMKSSPLMKGSVSLSACFRQCRWNHTICVPFKLFPTDIELRSAANWVFTTAIGIEKEATPIFCMNYYPNCLLNHHRYSPYLGLQLPAGIDHALLRENSKLFSSLITIPVLRLKTPLWVLKSWSQILRMVTREWLSVIFCSDRNSACKASLPRLVERYDLSQGKLRSLWAQVTSGSMKIQHLLRSDVWMIAEQNHHPLILTHFAYLSRMIILFSLLRIISNGKEPSMQFFSWMPTWIVFRRHISGFTFYQ